MKNGICIKCQAATVYEAKNGIIGEGGEQIVLEATKSSQTLTGASVQSYVCITCGYFENYLDSYYFDRITKSNAWAKVS